MKARRFRRLLLTLILVLVGACSVWGWKAQQQNALNRQLVSALIDNDGKQAISLVNEGADPNARCYSTPLPNPTLIYRRLLHHVPVFVNHNPTAFMFACGAEVYTPVNLRDSARYKADDAPLARAMLAHGADYNFRDSSHDPAIYYAVTGKRPHVAQALLEHGANVNQKDSLGATLLMRVAYAGDAEMTRFLTEHGANVSLEDAEGQTALYYAVFNRPNTDVIRLLLKHGADPDHPNKHGDTSLKFVQRRLRLDLVALLQGKH